ncbi:MAG: CBS domain-containing protein [Rhodospirillaceae bacterium]|nr:CBS domain-containing protein [Rhodospirillaceae bacterium]
MNEKKIVTVSEVMSTKVIHIEAAATVADAIGQMRNAGVSSLVVDRRDKQDEFGLVVVSDIAKEVIAPDRPPERVNVYEIMTKPVLSLPPEMNIRYAVRMLAQFGLSRALVVDEHRAPIGIVTLRDMVLRQAD